MVYPVFLITNHQFIAVINQNMGLVVQSAGNFSRTGGFEFNVYKSRPKVKSLEAICKHSGVTAEEFFKKTNQFMSDRLVTVLKAVLVADPSLFKSIKSNQKLI